MKLQNLLATLVVLLSQAIATFAADWYVVNLRGTCKSVGGSDRIFRRLFNNLTLIRDCRATPEVDRISIVDTNGDSVLDLYSFSGETVVANSTDTLRDRQMLLFPGSKSEASESAQISERITRNGEGVTTKIAS